VRPIEHVTNMYKQLYSLLVYTTNTIGFSVVRVARPQHGHKPCPTVAQEAIPTLIPPGISITGYTRYTFLHFRNWSVYIYILLREYTGNLFYSCLPPSTQKQVTQPIPRL